MTHLDKLDAKGNRRGPVRRMCKIAVDNRPPDDYVITIYPGGVIGIRRARCKAEYTMPLSAVYVRAIVMAAEAKKREKVKAKKLAKRGVLV